MIMVVLCWICGVCLVIMGLLIGVIVMLDNILKEL